MFPRLKLAWKEERYCDATDIVKNAVRELRKLSQNCFQECYRHFFTVAGRSVELHKGKRSLNDCTVLYFSEIKGFREHFEAITRN
jgi:hypothetical protein